MNNLINKTIKKYEQQGDFNYAKVSDEMIETAEKTLKVKLPKQYLDFIKMFGHGGIGGIETIGVGLTGRLIFVDTHLIIVKKNCLTILWLLRMWMSG